MATRQRRTRGTNKRRVQVAFYIEPDNKAKIDRIADAMGRSQGDIADLILNNIRVDETGRPHFYEESLVFERTQEELPLASSA